MSGWLAWHRALAWALIASNAAAGLWCLAAHRYRSVRGRPLVVAVVVAQLTALAQAIVGTVLMARYDLEPAPPARAVRVLRGVRRRHPLQLPHEHVHARQGVPALRRRLPVHHGSGPPRAGSQLTRRPFWAVSGPPGEPFAAQIAFRVGGRPERPTVRCRSGGARGCRRRAAATLGCRRRSGRSARGSGGSPHASPRRRRRAAWRGRRR